jgi:DNA-binding MarR family transcriptional regulator
LSVRCRCRQVAEDADTAGLSGVTGTPPSSSTATAACSYDITPLTGAVLAAKPKAPCPLMTPGEALAVLRAFRGRGGRWSHDKICSMEGIGYSVTMPPRSQRLADRSSDASPELRVLFSQLVRFETELWDAVEGRLRSDHGITLPFFEFMQIMSRLPNCRVQDIAAELSITVGGTSKIVDRIEAAGYCARHANPGDRRSSILTLTPAGKQLLPKITATVDDELCARLGSALSGQSLAQLIETLTRLRAGFSAADRAEKPA